MITDGSNGFKFIFGNLNSLYNAILKILNKNSEDLLQIGQNARKTVKENYSINNSAEKYRNIYCKFIK